MVALALCLALLLLLYLLVGNADEPPLPAAGESPSGPVAAGNVAPPLQTRFRPVQPAEPEKEKAVQVSKREPRPHRKSGKRNAVRARGKSASLR